MRSYLKGAVVRVLQEDWAPFQNIRRTIGQFTAQTGVKVEVTLSAIPEFWGLMEQSFLADEPAFDLIGADEIMLLQYARAGRVEPLESSIAADRYSLDDFEPAVLGALSHRGHLYGLPYAAVADVLIYRRDLFDRHGVAVPQTMEELTRAAVDIQQAVRGAGAADFLGITLRGAPSCGLNFWLVGSTWAPAWGVTWYDAAGRPTLDTPQFLAAVEHYIELLRLAGPPESWKWGFAECMACYSAGRAAMVIEPANEAAVVYDRGGEVADGTSTALVPAGPRGTRHAGLYCPPYAIPSRSRVKEAAWELAKFLCAPEQVLDDALRSGFVEVVRRSVLDDPRFAQRFRPDLVETTRATRTIARAERPTPRQGMLVGDIIGEELARALAGEQAPRAALANAQQRVSALGLPDTTV
jgi:sorbitol/mannitol transport system substrate-binding protein